jgi:hypothetical protein
MTTTPTTRRQARQDAKNRAGRTLVQGLAVTALVAVAATVNGVVTTWTGDDVTNGGAWVALGTSCVVSLLTAASSYVARLLAPPA